MHFIEKLNEELKALSLLNHPFYKAWSSGELELATLRGYAKEYYPHVAAFPRYISAIHSKCSNIKMRQVLLGNLVEEEQGDENHPELWLRFGEGVGAVRSEMEASKGENPGTRRLVEGYFELTDKGFAEGLGALYAYERQTPDVSKAKIEGLKKFYSIEAPSALQFFVVHQAADEWHTEEVAALIQGLSEEEQEKARSGALEGARLLWGFLDGMMEVAC